MVDRDMIVPPGWRYTLVTIAHAKRLLASKHCSNDMRLKTLEYFDEWSGPGEWLKPEMIGMIDPMPDEGEAIISEAATLGWSKALDVFARGDVFKALLAINPSIRKVLEFRNGRPFEGVT